MPKIVVICVECGTKVEKYPSQAGKYCSQPCRARHRARERMPLKPRRGETNPCPVCGEPVYRNKSEAARGRGLYCSRRCHHASMTKPPVIKSCPTCGKEMRLKPSQAARQHCSKRCEAIADIKRPLDRLHNGRRAKMDAQGYVMIWEPDHPNRAFHGWQYEHRVVVEKAIGRYLASDEHVHHKNGTKHDNRLDNLEVMAAVDHATLSARDYRDQVVRERSELEHYRRLFGPLPGDS